MARLRKFVAYRRLERPYTRYSKYKRANFVRGRPNCVIARFESGNKNKDYEKVFFLKSTNAVQIRQNAIESARIAANRFLEKKLGKGNYYFRLRVYPFHILRENPLASGAGADRLSTGMKKSFGKAISIAAQVKENQPIYEVRVFKRNVKVAKNALRRATYRLPCGCKIEQCDNFFKDKEQSKN